MRRFNNQLGFSLVELSIVLAIIGLIVSAGMKLFGPINQIVRMRETKERLDTAVQSVTGHAATRNTVMQNLSSIAVPRSSWGKEFAYLYDARFFTANPTKDTICGRSTSNLTVHTQEPNISTPNVVFAVVSSTEDFDFKSILDSEASAINGKTFPFTGDTGHTLHIDINNKDIVRLVTVSDLRTKIGCQGSPLKILNNEWPSGYEDVKYVAKFFADGGVPPYKWCITSTPALPSGLNFYSINSTTGAQIGRLGEFGPCTMPSDCSALTVDTNWVDATAPVFMNISGLPASTPATSRGNYTLQIMTHDSSNATLSQTNCTMKRLALTIYPK